MAESNKTFGGIFGGLKKMIFNEEYLQNENEQSTQPAAQADPKPQTKTQPVIVPKVMAPAQTTEEIVNKLYAALEKINNPGVDFFELWNAAEAMGGASAANLQNAFTSFKVLGLTKQTVLDTGEAYKRQLSKMIEDDVQKKNNERNALSLQQLNEKEDLEKEKADLEAQIKALTRSLDETNQKLSQLGNQYQPQIQAIDMKIQAGNAALQTVLNKIQSVLDIVKASVA
ncbi:MAG: hypothetical protein U0X40_10515 [Ferruginibacter sp.]